MEKQDHYLNEKGLKVFTEAYHRKRGFCCGCGCRHCPYSYDGVKEPRRSELLAKSKRYASQETYRKDQQGETFRSEG